MTAKKNNSFNFKGTASLIALVAGTLLLGDKPANHPTLFFILLCATSLFVTYMIFVYAIRNSVRSISELLVRSDIDPEDSYRRAVELASTIGNILFWLMGAVGAIVYLFLNSWFLKFENASAHGAITLSIFCIIDYAQRQVCMNYYWRNENTLYQFSTSYQIKIFVYGLLLPPIIICFLYFYEVRLFSLASVTPQTFLDIESGWMYLFSAFGISFLLYFVLGPVNAFRDPATQMRRLHDLTYDD